MPGPLAIAIDGPVASGKTAVGKLLADRLGFRFLDTGMMYRAVALATIRSGTDPEDTKAVGRLARAADIQVVSHQGQERLVLDGEDVTGDLREAESSAESRSWRGFRRCGPPWSPSSGAIADEGPIVMAGRDIGTVVLPDAPVSVYLKAPLDVRARRRHIELQELGVDSDYDRVIEELRRRDKIDSEREDSPLRPADDAVQIDTEAQGVQELAEKIERLFDGG